MPQYKIEINADDRILSAVSDGDTTLLELIQSTGLATRNPCRNGVCGLCKCRLVTGQITYHWKVPHGLWEKDIANGYILPCIAYPVDNSTLDSLSLRAC
jgi:ferredoxin